MRNHQQHDPQTADIATLGDATFQRNDFTSCPWIERPIVRFHRTEELIRYGATFWKPIEPEPGYRLVEDHERVGEKPEGCRCSSSGVRWVDAFSDSPWEDNLTYVVPIKQVVAWKPSDCSPSNINMYAAYFANQKDRDRAVRDANERER